MHGSERFFVTILIKCGPSPFGQVGRSGVRSSKYGGSRKCIVIFHAGLFEFFLW